jgi:DNA polymerase III gamma/tau subunit
VDAVQRGLGLVVDDRAAQLARAAVERDLPAGLALLGAVRDDGLEVRAFVREVVAALRNALLMRAGAGDTLHLSETQRAELAPIAEGAQAADIVAALRALGEVDFAGDAYDALPAEIAFAAHAAGFAPAVEGAPTLAEPAQPARALAAPRGERQQQRRADAPPERPRRSPAPPKPRAQEPSEAAQSSEAPAAAAPRAASAPRREPPPPVAPDHAPEGGTASPELIRLREQWPSIREAARDRHYKAGALLNSRCYIKDIAGDTVEVGFQSSLLVEKATGDAEVLAAIREAIGDAVGRPVSVVPVVWSDLQPGAAPPPLEGGPQGGPPPVAAERGGGHLIDEARKLGAVPLDG